MQNKGFIKVIAVLLTLICLFYFSFSFVTSHYEKKAAAMGEEEGKAYLDSMANERVYMGKTLKECQALQIGLVGSEFVFLLYAREAVELCLYCLVLYLLEQ